MNGNVAADDDELQLKPGELRDDAPIRCRSAAARHWSVAQAKDSFEDEDNGRDRHRASQTVRGVYARRFRSFFYPFTAAATIRQRRKPSSRWQ
jgi:hypothetical protein